MTILRTATVSRQFFGSSGLQVAIQANGTSAAWPLANITQTGTLVATPIPLAIPPYSEPGPASLTPPFAVLVVHNGGSRVSLRFGNDSTIHVGPHLGGVHLLEPGQSVLFDENHNIAPSWIAVMAPGGSAKVTVTLGRTAKVISFDSSSVDSLDYTDPIGTSGGGIAVGYLSAPFTISGTGSVFNEGTISATGFPT